jgi:hypothetical protein
MFVAFVLIAIYGSSFLPLLVLTLARVGKAEIWILTGLDLLWLAFMAWLHGQLFKASIARPDFPWTIAGTCAGACLLWAVVLSLLKKAPGRVPGPLHVMRE